MSIARDAQDAFKEALKYLEELERLGEFSKSQESMLRLMCLDFLEKFSKWKGEDEVSSSVFEAYINSTPMYDLLDLRKNEWCKNLSERFAQKQL